jgi:hypothetical protein
MDDATKAAVAAEVYRYLFARAWFRKSELPEIGRRVYITPASLEHELGRGLRLLAGGVLVYPQASPVVVADDQDLGFLAAITGQDDAIELPADDLANLRRYVLRGGEPPSRKPEPEQRSSGGEIGPRGVTRI